MIYTNSDGGARGNPGPAAIGAVIEVKKDDIWEKQAEISECIGETTNNQASAAMPMEMLDAEVCFIQPAVVGPERSVRPCIHCIE